MNSEKSGSETESKSPNSSSSRTSTPKTPKHVRSVSERMGQFKDDGAIPAAIRMANKEVERQKKIQARVGHGQEHNKF